MYTDTTLNTFKNNFFPPEITQRPLYYVNENFNFYQRIPAFTVFTYYPTNFYPVETLKISRPSFGNNIQMAKAVSLSLKQTERKKEINIEHDHEKEFLNKKRKLSEEEKINEIKENKNLNENSNLNENENLKKNEKLAKENDLEENEELNKTTNCLSQTTLTMSKYPALVTNLIFREKEHDRNIYFFFCSKIYNNTIAYLSCRDKKCLSKAKYNLVTKEIKILSEHSKPISAHSYITGYSHISTILILEFMKENPKVKGIEILKDGKNILENLTILGKTIKNKFVVKKIKK